LDTTQLDLLTDRLAKTDATSFPLDEKLLYYNIAYGLLYGLIINEQEDNYEEEDTKSTVAGQRDYAAKSRIHHINWLKIDYGQGFIPATYKRELDLVTEYGNELENALSQWNSSDPIYFYKGSSFFVLPAPTDAQAGADRLKVSHELLPNDLVASDTPLLPENYHHLLARYAAFQYHDNNGEDTQAAKRQTQFNEGAKLMIGTMFPRARQEDLVAQPPNDTGATY
jgi:hypothetical protein